jgi:hypothetical protein
VTKEERGQLAVLKVEQRALELGFIVSRPSTPARYDLVIDDGKQCHRVQVKYANGKTFHAQGVAIASLRREGRTYQRGEIDAIVVYVAPVDCVCWFGSEEFHGKANLYIRYQPAKNGQNNKCKFVDSYKW